LSKLFNLIKRAIITLASKDDTNFQIVQVNYLGKTKNVEIVSPYGLYSNPKEQSVMLIFNVNGQEENIAGIPYNPYNRFKNLKPGEVATGNPHKGTRIYFDENGDIIIDANGGNVYVNGSSEPLVLGTAMTTLFNLHTHPGNNQPPTQPMGSTQVSTKNFTE